MNKTSPKELFSDKELNFLLDVAFEALGERMSKQNLKRMMKIHKIPRDLDCNDHYPHDELNSKLIDYLNGD